MLRIFCDVLGNQWLSEVSNPQTSAETCSLMMLFQASAASSFTSCFCWGLRAGLQRWSTSVKTQFGHLTLHWSLSCFIVLNLGELSCPTLPPNTNANTSKRHHSWELILCFCSLSVPIFCVCHCHRPMTPTSASLKPHLEQHLSLYQLSHALQASTPLIFVRACVSLCILHMWMCSSLSVCARWYTHVRASCDTQA